MCNVARSIRGLSPALLPYSGCAIRGFFSAVSVGEEIQAIRGPGCPAGFQLATGLVVQSQTKHGVPVASLPPTQQAEIANTLQYARETLYKSDGPPYRDNHGRAAPTGSSRIALKPNQPKVIA